MTTAIEEGLSTQWGSNDAEPVYRYSDCPALSPSFSNSRASPSAIGYQCSPQSTFLEVKL
jgi:hypothetical protein